MRSFALAVAAVVLTTAATAEAAFPGRNGYIFGGMHKETGCVWEQCGPTDPPFDDQKWIVRLNPRTGEQRQVCFRCTSPAVSPNGRMLAWVRAPGDDAPAGIFISRIDGRGVRRITRDGDQPAWSPDGKRLIFEVPATARDPRVRIATVRVDDRKRHTITTGRHPVWSTRGRIAFTRFVSDGAFIVFSVFTARSDGTGAKRVTRGRFHDIAPDWSPDGRRLVFGRFVDGATAVDQPDGLFTLNLHGGLPRVLTHQGDRDPIWSPDGRLILYVRGAHNRPAPQLSVIRPDGTGQRALLPRGTSLLDADWQAKPGTSA